MTFFSCTKEKFFTNEQLALLDIYTEGDQFSMTNDNQDTIVFTIKERNIKKRTHDNDQSPGIIKYEALIYTLNLSSDTNDVYQHYINASSINENILKYTFRVDSINYSGAIDITTCTDTIYLYGKNYNHVNCNTDCCFSSEIGFFVFYADLDKLTIIE